MGVQQRPRGEAMPESKLDPNSREPPETYPTAL
jgi:hypothetical protein